MPCYELPDEAAPRSKHSLVVDGGVATLRNAEGDEIELRVKPRSQRIQTRVQRSANTSPAKRGDRCPPPTSGAAHARVAAMAKAPKLSRPTRGTAGCSARVAGCSTGIRHRTAKPYGDGVVPRAHDVDCSNERARFAPSFTLRVRVSPGLPSIAARARSGRWSGVRARPIRAHVQHRP